MNVMYISLLASRTKKDNKRGKAREQVGVCGSSSEKSLPRAH